MPAAAEAGGRPRPRFPAGVVEGGACLPPVAALPPAGCCLGVGLPPFAAAAAGVFFAAAGAGVGAVTAFGSVFLSPPAMTRQKAAQVFWYRMR